MSFLTSLAVNRKTVHPRCLLHSSLRLSFLITSSCK
jgi:hypothetical protein